MNTKNFQWVDKYSPKTIDEAILPEEIRLLFEGYIREGQLPNLLLYGPAGSGKTSAVRAAINQLGGEILEINGSLDGNVDVIRNKMTNFVSALSMDGGRKYILIDEADYLNIQSTQPSLRKFMEDNSSHCSFILTANYPYKIMKELKSRCTEVAYHFTQQNVKEVLDGINERCYHILDEEDVEYDKKSVSSLVKKLAPDWRKVIHTLQTESVKRGKIDAGVLAASDKDESFRTLARHMKKQSFGDVREWVTKENIMTPHELFEQLFTKLPLILTDDTIPDMILIVARYQYQSAFVASQEINNAACLIEIMKEVQFK